MWCLSLAGFFFGYCCWSGFMCLLACFWHVAKTFSDKNNCVECCRATTIPMHQPSLRGFEDKSQDLEPDKEAGTTHHYSKAPKDNHIVAEPLCLHTVTSVSHLACLSCLSWWVCVVSRLRFLYHKITLMEIKQARMKRASPPMFDQIGLSFLYPCWLLSSLGFLALKVVVVLDFFCTLAYACSRSAMCPSGPWQSAQKACLDHAKYKSSKLCVSNQATLSHAATCPTRLNLRLQVST